MIRNLSGIYFRYNGENVCFENLPESEQDRILEEKSPEFVKSLAKILAQVIVELGDQCDLVRE